ncbi:hypothetical protein IPU62_15105 [Pseudogracilibacillus auburnensis]|nr:hypothetical protein [Pseudogracilibacillus auburnensis]
MEVILVLAIISMVLVLISNVQIFGQKQYVNQSQQMNHQDHVRLAVKLITKEIRKENAVSVEGNSLLIGTDLYSLKDTMIEKNGRSVISDISEFNISPLPDGVNVEIKSIADQHGKKASISTVIYIRK